MMEKFTCVCVRACVCDSDGSVDFQQVCAVNVHLRDFYRLLFRSVTRLSDFDE